LNGWALESKAELSTLTVVGPGYSRSMASDSLPPSRSKLPVQLSQQQLSLLEYFPSINQADGRMRIALDAFDRIANPQPRIIDSHNHVVDFSSTNAMDTNKVLRKTDFSNTLSVSSLYT
jgi:hypothetical protein